jgi:rRNA maturation endonuclease Nob1
VVDANAIIKQIPLRQTINSTLETDEEFQKMYDVYTLQEVVQEIRDEKARLFLQNLPYELNVKSAVNVEKEDIETVEDFSRDTGDKNTLS